MQFIFEKFNKVETQAKKTKGSGLGLVTVKKIIDLHKGLIRVKSEENKGTTFIIKLPKLI
ncbi:sensor protein SrrB [bacterium BMS3Abin04]|nr:sensor protein SrrB [bacterium BMS3Abin04]